jgi:tetrahydromethanopterin S-methyltransferase subunit G
MPEPNGHQDNDSRLDRIERAVEHIINEHEKLIDDHRQLLKAQVVMVESIDKIGKHIVEVDTRLGNRIDEIGGKLDGLINMVDSDHREFHQRLKRIEERELHG